MAIDVDSSLTVRDLEHILSDAADHQERLLNEAFEAGRAVGRREAAESLQYKLGMVLSAEMGTGPSSLLDSALANGSTGAASDPQANAESERRASPGSVKPTIAKLIAEQPGLSVNDVTEQTGFKKNSVRGTLWLLSTEGLIERRDGRWYPIAQKEEAAGTVSEQDAPTASEPDLPSWARFPINP